MKIITKNKRAFFDYEIIDTYEAGIVLVGDEVKSLRRGTCSLDDAYGFLRDGELVLMNCYIAPYTHAYTKDSALARKNRKLLLHRREIDKLAGEVARKGRTIIPLKLYFNEKGKVKVELGVAVHKKLVSKKQTIKEREITRQAEREIKIKIR